MHFLSVLPIDAAFRLPEGTQLIGHTASVNAGIQPVSMLAARTESVVDLGRVSPAAHLGGLFAAAEVSGSRGVRVRELPFLTMVGLRVEPGSAAAERAQDLLGAALPARCGAVAAAGDSTVLWLSPDEFLLVSGDKPTAVTQSLPHAVILWKIADESYRILPRSSFADFLGRWLLDAMAEFAIPELP